MKLKMEPLFPTLIGRGELPKAKLFNQKLLKEIESFSEQDKMGREWSKENYRGGYTSYASLSDMHRRTPLFDQFAEWMQPQAEQFAKAQGWNLRGLNLEMTHCWMNIMPKHTYHTLHMHPQSVISGSYYVSVPKGSVSLKLEDPRMSFYMNAPVRELGNRKDSKLYYEIEPRAGHFVIFESWLRHEVPPNQSTDPRVSLSFNYAIEATQ